MVQVWLITYNTTTLDLESLLNTTVNCTGDSVFYIFNGVPTDSIRIKAAIPDSIFSDSGFIPTYHISHFYWHDAEVPYHWSGTVQNLLNINMDYGHVVSGPGFISGNVSTGANRGTSGTAPAVGLLVILENASGSPVGHTLTDGSGNYSFSSLPLGTYRIHAEALNYLSTDYSGINLTSSSPGQSGANFIQHTLSHYIAPGSAGIPLFTANSPAVITYPNPSTGSLYLQWQETSTENGKLVITDIAGHEIYSTGINLTKGTGVSQVDVSRFANGLYMVSIKSENINYTGKIQVINN